MTPPYTVGMLSSYSGLTQRDWLWSQSPEPFGVWGQIQMQAPEPEPDYLLLYNFHDFPADPEPLPLRQRWRRSARAWWQQQQAQAAIVRQRLAAVPKERIIFLTREPPFEEKERDRVRQYAQAQVHCGYVSGPDDFAPTPDYMPAIWYYDRSFRELADLGPPPKTERCCWITSGITRTARHRLRMDFLNLLRDQETPFDLYGRGLPAGSNSRGELINKANAMGPYYYNLAIENYASNDWYVSEKLWDALLAWCLPIYYGGDAADRLLPPGSFLRLPGLDDNGAKFIQDVTSSLDAWHEAREAIAEARQIILHKLNLLNWLSEFVGR
ncbi:MAG: glycosyltransferase family 10 domain-containing protein [Spirulinaceae cyanobacterium]